MTTLITHKVGKILIGRCDAKCHNAEHPKCTCICGGMNHRAGGTQAIVNTHKKGLVLIAEGFELHIPQDADKIVPKEQQINIFD